jgi:membrane protein DedA with SNARE-associated domain/rhodanese-related sulfurtransferase
VRHRVAADRTDSVWQDNSIGHTRSSECEYRQFKHALQSKPSRLLELKLMDYRLLAILGAVFAGQLGLPVPAAPALVVGGALAAAGDISPIAFVVGAVAACMAADSAWFLAGRIYGSDMMKFLCRLSLTPDSCVGTTQTRFERFGVNALLIAKFIPGLGTLAPPLAGAIRMSWLRFLVFGTLGATAWVIVGATVGVVFRHPIEQLLPLVTHYRVPGVVALFLILVGYVAYKWRQRARFFSSLRMARIEAADLDSLIASGAAPVIVDVRTPTAVILEPRGIPGALRVPLQETRQRLLGLPRERDIVLYCTCPDEVTAAEAAKILMDSGFRRVRPLRGGLEAWIERGYAVDTIPMPEPATTSGASGSTR